MIDAPLALVDGAVEFLLRNTEILKAMPETIREAVIRLYIHRDRIQIGMSRDCSRYDRDLLYTFKPGECRFKNREYDTHYLINSRGLRDTESALVGPEVIFLGDSFTQGWGVEQDDAFPQQVGKISGLRTLNAGIGSYGTAREYLMLKRLDTSRIKAVVLQYAANDYTENATFVTTGGLRPSSPERFERLLKKGARNVRYFPFKYSYYIVRDAVRKLAERPRGRSPAEESAVFLPILRNIVAYVPGVPVFVMSVRLPLDQYRRWNELLAAAVRADAVLASSVVVAEVTPDFDASRGYVLDGHWKAPCHRTVACRLAAALAARNVAAARR